MDEEEATGPDSRPRVLPLPSCYKLGKSLYYSVPQFLRLQSEGKMTICLFRNVIEIELYFKCWEE